MAAESTRRLASNNLFVNLVVSLLTTKYRFSRIPLRHFISATKIRYLRNTDIRLLQHTVL